MPLISTVQYRSHVGLMRLLTTKSMHFFSTHSTHTIPLIHKQATTAPAHIPQYHSHTFACMFSCVQLCATPWTVAHQSPLFIGFSRQKYWSGLPFPCPEDLPDPRIEPMSLQSPALACRFFATSTIWEAPRDYLVTSQLSKYLAPWLGEFPKSAGSLPWDAQQPWLFPGSKAEFMLLCY